MKFYDQFNLQKARELLKEIHPDTDLITYAKPANDYGLRAVIVMPKYKTGTGFFRTVHHRKYKIGFFDGNKAAGIRPHITYGLNGGCENPKLVLAIAYISIALGWFGTSEEQIKDV